tara:strand:- start:44 stop:262 length:219 start_codon:yes stop_codon:yes gene_type:complete
MNAQKRKLMIALNEAFERGRAIGRGDEKMAGLFGPDWPSEPNRKKIEQAIRDRLEELANWWDQVLSDEEDLL